MKTSLLILLAACVVNGCNSIEVATGLTHGIDENGNVWMNPPPPGEGIQMAIQPFDVPKDTEIQGNFYFDLPSDVDFNVGRIEIAMNEGTHHMNCFVTPIIWPKDSGRARTAIMTKNDGIIDTQSIRYQFELNASIVWNQSDLMFEAELPYVNWSLPELFSSTDSAQQPVIKLAARQHMVIESHYVNQVNPKDVRYDDGMKAPNNKGAIIINLWKPSSGKPLIPASMLVAKKTAIKILPFSEAVFIKDCNFTPLSMSWPIYILAMTGHFHSRGKSFVVDKMCNVYDKNGTHILDSVIERGIYQNASWNEPAFQSYEIPVMLNKGEFLRYTTHYVNNTNCVFNFGPHQRTDEMCNLFAWFVPGWNGGQTLYDNVN
jgi:hypothetical protein